MSPPRRIIAPSETIAAKHAKPKPHPKVEAAKPAARFKSSTELTALLHHDELYALHNGVNKPDVQIPSAKKRQEDLIGTVIEAAMPTILEDRLQRTEKCSLQDMLDLDVFGTKGKTLAQIKSTLKEILKDMGHSKPDNKMNWSAEEAKVFVAKVNAAKLFATRDDFASTHAIIEFNHKVDAYQAAMKQLEKSREGLAPAPSVIPKLPEHPYIVSYRSNRFRKDVLDIFETGEKSYEACLKKTERRNAPWDMSDINRITIKPRSPRISGIFNAHLKQRVKKIKVTNEKMNEEEVRDLFYEKPFTVHETGLFDAKVNIGLTNGFGKDQKTRGAVAEIKKMPPFMQDAYFLSHEVYETYRKFVGDNDTFQVGRLSAVEVNYFMQAYTDCMLKFSDPKYQGRFKAFTADEMADKGFTSDGQIIDRVKELRLLLQSIFVDSLKQLDTRLVKNQQWQREYILAALTQNRAGTHNINEDLLESINPALFAEIYEQVSQTRQSGRKR